MSLDPLLLALLVVAVAIGWLLGRHGRGAGAESGPATGSTGDFGRDYFQGLDHLMSDRTDEAIESFMRALEINSDTIPAHLALARLLRRKGDVERAIRVHQTLLARPGLNHHDFIRIQLALARDYEATGLLDRAEKLLREIVREGGDRALQGRAQRQLIKLYEKEREWQQALEIGRQLDAEARRQVAHELAHYCCELAQQALARQGWRSAEGHLREALKYNPASVRASLLCARLAMGQGQWRRAIRPLKQVQEQDPTLVSEALEPLERCYQQLRRLDEFETWLRDSLVRAPSTTLLLALVERIREREGVRAAGEFLTDELKSRPSIRGVNRLIDLHLEYGSRSARESLGLLRGLTGELEASKPIYRCDHCGYAGRILHWQCPSCRQWDSTRPIQGLEGE